MKIDTKSIKLLSAIAVVAAFSIFMVYTSYTGNSSESDAHEITYIDAVEVPYTVDELVKESYVIAVGTVTEVGSVNEVAIGGEPEAPQYTIPIRPVTIKIERELTGNYLGNEIVVTTISGKENVIVTAIDPKFTVGEKVILFLSYERGTVFGDVYVSLGGIQGKFSIDEKGVAHNPKYGDIPVQQLIGQILEVRAKK